jgi:prepilin-type N-terminal cleavage/methylation domain-containing protein/prepilin-type processing-associated H-X9-DG protein
MRMFHKQVGPSSRQRGFTLVELLVVIGIIAVLISILLPTLSKVRRQANTLQCSSNMRQLATAMLMYIADSKGRFPAAEFGANAPAYPYGFSWPNALVRGNYIKGPGLSCYTVPNSPTSAKKLNRNSPFRCPEGIDEEGGSAGDYPTDIKNNSFKVANDGLCAQEGFGIPSWYQLNCRNTSPSNAWAPSSTDSSITARGARVTPFVGFQSGATNNMPLIKDPAWQRSIGMVKKSAELLMIVEAADQNWYDQKPSTRYPGNFLKRLGARHGQRTPESGGKWPGGNAFTNFAFFDGHVALYPSKTFQNQNGDITKDDEPDLQVKDVIFYVNKQW